ncbi:MAG: hypothetical protein EBS81_07615 [Gammaproteobacteria bacterium]|nr:hypothetical protein [Gammaproteobacteria bacterium]
MKLNLICIFLIIFSLSSKVIAEDDVITMDDVYSKLEENLDLTEEQSEKFKPIYFDHREEVQNLLKKNGIDLYTGSFEKRMGIRQLRSIKRGMDKLYRANNAQLVGILNKEQIKEYKKTQEKQRIEIRDRLMNNRR